MPPSPSLASRIVAMACVVLWCAWAPARAQPPAAPAPDQALQVFRARVDSYLALHRELEARVAPLDARGQPLHTYLSRQILATAIRRARPAQQGNIFTPAVAQMFRAIIADTHDGFEAWLSSLQRQYLSVPGLHPQVNESCGMAEMSELPAVLLGKLPPLAGDLQYRLVHFDLVLWDVHAYLVVDFVPDAFRLPEATVSARNGCI
jgi:hypothetical protein